MQSQTEGSGGARLTPAGLDWPPASIVPVARQPCQILTPRTVDMIT